MSTSSSTSTAWTALSDDIAFEIVSHIDPCDTASLLACSLTHPSWTLAAQRRLYRTLKIRNGETIRRWFDFDVEDRFTPYVRHLIYCGDQATPLRPRDFMNLYDSRFLYFNKVDTLEMRYLELDRFDLNLFRLAFGHLRDTLRALLISDGTMTLNKFLELLTIFPRLHCVGLSRFTIGHESSPLPWKLPTFCGTLDLSGPVDKHGLGFIFNLMRVLPNSAFVRLRLNLSHHATRRLLEIPRFASNVTVLLLGYQDGFPEHIDLSRCENLRILSVRSHGGPEGPSASLNSRELFKLLGTITSRQLEFIVLEASEGFSLMRHSLWGQFFKILSVLQGSCKQLSVIMDPFEKFLEDNFRKGQILARFIGIGKDDS